jgi:hypothetical protein
MTLLTGTERKGEGVGVMPDKQELKLEEIEVSHTL